MGSTAIGEVEEQVSTETSFNLRELSSWFAKYFSFLYA